ncbi:GspH/FimT family pseudopilin [Polaromonas sp.]|uniref:GspH/FimT family pseudopilin n=1 Tax=Polaromonas sp. TaxID=1869339 RepID=UPI003BB6A05D
MPSIFIHLCQPPTNTGGNSRHSGFTLIELLMTIVIASVLMLVATPSFVQFQRNAKLSDSVSSFITAANAARANAMKQGINTYLIPVTGTDWSSGWMVYADTNWSKTYNSDTETVILSHEPISADVIITTPTASTLASGYLLFNGSGYPRDNNNAMAAGTIVMKNTDLSKSISIIIDNTGRVRSCKTGSTGC